MKSDFKSSFIEGKTGMCLERDDLMIIIVVVIPHIIQQESRLKIPQCTMIMQFPDFSQSFFSPLHLALFCYIQDDEDECVQLIWDF